MEKYCPKCNKIYNDMKANHCINCGTKLKTREKRKPIPRELRHKIFVRDGYRCRECGKSNEETSLEIDHIIPISKGGKTEINNLWVLCKDCNQSKSNDIWKDERLESYENELKTLLDVLHKSEEGLKNTADYDEELEFKFRIKKLKDEEIPLIKAKINKLKNELKVINDKRKIHQKENQRKERLFKELYIDSDNEFINELKNRFYLNESSKEEVLRYLVNKYDEDEINELKLMNKWTNNKNNSRESKKIWKECPVCGHKLNSVAKKCPYCNYIFKFNFKG